MVKMKREYICTECDEPVCVAVIMVDEEDEEEMTPTRCLYVGRRARWKRVNLSELKEVSI